MAEFVSCDFSHVRGVLIEATTGPPVGESQVSFEDLKIRYAIDDSGCAAAAIIATNSKNTAAVRRWINLSEWVAKGNSVDIIICHSSRGGS